MASKPPLEAAPAPLPADAAVWPRPSRGRRAATLALAVGTALFVAWALLERPGYQRPPYATPAAPGACTPPCAGGLQPVTMLPAAPPGPAGGASAASR